MRGTGTRGAAVAAALLLALTGTAACSDAGGGGDGGGTAADTVVTGEPQVVENAAENFAVEVPAGWMPIVIDTATLQRLFQEAGDEIDEAVENQIRLLAGRGGKLFAYDRARRTTNLNVLKLPPRPGVTTEQLAESLPAELSKELRDVTVESVTIGAGPAVKATGSRPVGDDRNLFQLQYYVLTDDAMFIVVLATDDPARDRPVLEGIGQSFRLLG